jgi:hypothetical protein
MDWIIERLGEASTWRGLVGLVTAAGVAISPELATQIIAVGVGLIGLINVVRKERAKPVA